MSSKVLITSSFFSTSQFKTKFDFMPVYGSEVQYTVSAPMGDEQTTFRFGNGDYSDNHPSRLVPPGSPVTPILKLYPFIGAMPGYLACMRDSISC